MKTIKIDHGFRSDPESFAFAVYTTEFGGLAKNVEGELEFIEKPNRPGFKVGDKVPLDWNFSPENLIAIHKRHQTEMAIMEELARRGEPDPDLIADFDREMDEVAEPLVPAY